MSKYLVYTCVTDNYDKVRKIVSKQDPNIDFVCFTDSINKQIDLRNETGWIFLPIPDDLKSLDKRRQARFIKICVYKYLKGYSGYLWIDAPIIIIGNIGEFIKEHPFDETHGIYVSKHYMRNCIYQEFAQVLKLNKDRHANVYEQYQRYKNMNYPSNAGLAETSILYRDFSNLKVQTHAAVWIDEIMNYSYRDQLSFNWSAWQTKTQITYINEDIYKRDVENETSKYFFLPWPKHNNPAVAEQLKSRLEKNPLANIVRINKNKNEIFEEEYKQFIEELKKKQIKKTEPSAIIQHIEQKDNGDLKQKKKRGRKKK